MSLLVNRQPGVPVPSGYAVVVFCPCVWFDLVLVAWLFFLEGMLNVIVIIDTDIDIFGSA